MIPTVLGIWGVGCALPARVGSRREFAEICLSHTEQHGGNRLLEKLSG